MTDSTVLAGQKVTAAKGDEIYIGPTPPGGSPVVGWLWMNTSFNPACLMIYDGTQWSKQGRPMLKRIDGLTTVQTVVTAGAAGASWTSGTLSVPLESGLLIRGYVSNPTLGRSSLSLIALPGPVTVVATSTFGNSIGVFEAMIFPNVRVGFLRVHATGTGLQAGSWTSLCNSTGTAPNTITGITLTSVDATNGHNVSFGPISIYEIQGPATQ